MREKVIMAAVMVCAPWGALSAGYLAGNAEQPRPEGYAFLATVAAVGFLVWGWLKPPKVEIAPTTKRVFYAYTLILIVGAPFFFGQDGMGAIYAAFLIVPLVFWLVGFVRVKAWILAWAAWSLISAVMTAVIFNSQNTMAKTGLWVSWFSRF
jgi:hypothetical protein